jgi:hypothetical protein
MIKDNCETFCRNITSIVFSPVADEAVTGEVGRRLHRILNSTDEEILLYRRDFDPALFNNAPEELRQRPKEHAAAACEEGHKSKNGMCPTTGLPCMVKITHPRQFLTGKQVGQLIIKARQGRIREEDFFRELFKLMSGQDAGLS